LANNWGDKGYKRVDARADAGEQRLRGQARLAALKAMLGAVAGTC
jgi:hypothetical protein